MDTEYEKSLRVELIEIQAAIQSWVDLSDHSRLSFMKDIQLERLESRKSYIVKRLGLNSDSDQEK